MKQRYIGTRLEVWRADYINIPERREEKDKDAKIVQIEHGHENFYMVEVLDARPPKREEAANE